MELKRNQQQLEPREEKTTNFGLKGADMIARERGAA